MANELDPRLGVIDADGKRTWPAQTVSGRKYERPADTLDLGERHFAVLDVFPSKDFDEKLAEVKAALPKTEQAVVKRQDRRAAEEAKVDADATAQS